MDDSMRVPLHVPDGRVRSTPRTEPGHGLMRVESPREGAPCRCCGREMCDLHGWDAVVRLCHWPRFDVPVFLARRPTRSRCPYGTGTPTTPPRGAWDAPRSPHTNADEPWAVRMVLNAPVTAAARTLGVAAETLAGLRDRGIARAVDWDAWERLGVLGLDASALTRGHREVVVWVTGPLAGGGVEILAVRADRQTETVAACLGARPAPLWHTSARACPAMDEGVGRASAAAVLWADIVSARCHVARASRDGAARVRQQALQRRKSVRLTAESAESTGARWPCRQ